jgi:hypothetical protein
MTRCPRAVLALTALLALPAAAGARAEAPPPLYTHTDEGPVAVHRGPDGPQLPLAETAERVRRYVADVNALIARGAAVPAQRLQTAMDRGRKLQETDTALTGTLYLEEALRRLQRLRLARIPVAETNVAAAYADEYPARWPQPVVLRRGHDDLGVTYGQLAACLELAETPNAKPPHKVRVEPDRTLWTRLDGTPLALDIVPFQDDRLLLRSIVLGTSRSLGFKDKAQVTRFLLESCV